jgi:hypothetical protein
MFFLLSQGANIKTVTPRGWTAIHLASSRWQEVFPEEVIDQMLVLCPDHVRRVVTSEGWTALHIAAYHDLTDWVAMTLSRDGSDILNLADYAGRSALFYAAKNGHEDMVMILVEAGADVSMVDRFGAGPLMAAARNGHAELVRYFLKHHPEHGKLESKDVWDITAADWAYNSGRRRMLAFLERLVRIEQGDDVSMSEDELEEDEGDEPAWDGVSMFEDEPEEYEGDETDVDEDDETDVDEADSSDVDEDDESEEDGGDEDQQFHDTDDYDVGSDVSEESLLYYSKQEYFVWCDTCTRSINTDETAFKCNDCPYGGWIICEDCATESRGCMDSSHAAGMRARIKITLEKLGEPPIEKDLLHSRTYLHQGLRRPAEGFEYEWYSYIEI